MTTGIYLLTFGTEDDIQLYYVGKSVDIQKRWVEHITKLIKGTAAKAMQEAYLKYGEPELSILKECHPDHLDVLEPIYIKAYKDTHTYNCINSSVPQIYYVLDSDTVNLINNEEDNDYWNLSTLEHIQLLEKQLDQEIDFSIEIQRQKDVIEHLEHKLATIDLGEQGNFYREQYYDTQTHINNLVERMAQLQTELDTERNKPWYKKLW